MNLCSLQNWRAFPIDRRGQTVEEIEVVLVTFFFFLLFHLQEILIALQSAMQKK